MPRPPFIVSSSSVSFTKVLQRFSTAMAMLVLCCSTAIRPALCCVEGATASTNAIANWFPLQRTNLEKNRWRIACARADHATDWRRECSELRVEIQELREALGDAWMQDEMKLLELEKLVSTLVDVYAARTPAEVGNVQMASREARDCDLAVINFAIGRNEDEASDIAKLELEAYYQEIASESRSKLEEATTDEAQSKFGEAKENVQTKTGELKDTAQEHLVGADEHYKNAIIISELRSEELRAKQEGLSTLRRLKHLNVHDYVHSALQASHLRSWLKSRGIAE